MAILKVENLKTHFFTEEGLVKAVDGVSFELERGKVLGIVGESGSGKSVMSLSIMKLIPYPGRIVEGKIYFDGKDITQANESEMQSIRGNRISMVFQDPMTSLNPVFKIGFQLVEAVRVHKKVSKKEALDMAVKILKEVGIPDAEEAINRYPHEFSGGMRQRVMIAMALINDPDILIADEPTTALDVTVQAQILDLMNRLKEEFNSSIILITHDLGVVAEMSDEVIVMYAGRIFERGSVEDIFYKSRNPYTYSLMRSLPRLDVDQKRLQPIKGNPPSLIRLPQGCPFHPRCELAKDICKKKVPELLKVGTNHYSYCHFAAELEFNGGKVGTHS
ncbi:MAG: ABC transporter ATP-binding protein [Actinobacteria bacterium]|nr:ABC transporter ATP-binding protein [Actinomycetota bacterium]